MEKLEWCGYLNAMVENFEDVFIRFDVFPLLLSLYCYPL